MNDRLQSLEKLIFQHLHRQEMPENSLGSFIQSKLPELGRSVAVLSELYTRQRHRVSEALLQESKHRQAYLAYFLPVNLAKLKAILEEIWAHPRVHGLLGPEIRVLDLGCGPGTHLLGFLEFWAEHPKAMTWLDCIAVDAVKSNLNDAQALFAHHASLVRGVHSARDCRLRTVRADLTRPLGLKEERPFDFIVLGNVLNELFREDSAWLKRRCELVLTLVNRHLAPHGFLILIEPALKETSRELLLLRNQLLERAELKVYSPCLHSLPCPAVAAGNQSDWCHEDRPWTPPEVIRQIDALIGNRKDSLKFSYVVLSRTGFSLKDALGRMEAGPPAASSPGALSMWRVVSESLREKGKLSFFFCGEPGRFKFTRLDKHASEVNRAFACLYRGQVVNIANWKARSSNEARVEKDTAVTVKSLEDS